MQALSWPSIACYSVFGIFVYYQQLHTKDFRGNSQAFGLILSLSAFLGMITGFAYLAYYGWTVVWWAPIVALIIGVAAAVPAVFVEKVIGKHILSLAAFIGWPVFAYYMFHYIPKQ